jgi:NAD(P)H dehydrogenase (quinone)
LTGKALIVLAHPGERSLSRLFAMDAYEALAEAGQDAEVLDLTARNFAPALSQSERARYYSQEPEIPLEAGALADTEILVMVFPTWWFGPPAVLKGWIDRVFAPTIAFDHASGFGPIKPRLVKLRHVIVVTTLGSPWWVDRLVMFRPVKRILKRAVFRLCAPQACFRMLSLYAAEKPSKRRISAFSTRIRRVCQDASRDLGNPI